LPTGIDCGAKCSTTFPGGQVVTLTAVQGRGSIFKGWQGSCAGTGLTCTLTMSEAKNVVAVFDTTALGDGILIYTAYTNDVPNIWRMSLDGSERKQLTNGFGKGLRSLGASVSPNGKQVLFSANDTHTFDIYLMNIDGTGLVQLTDTPEVDEQGASFSPNGQEILFTSDKTGRTEIYIMNRDGANVRQLTVSDQVKEEDPPITDNCCATFSPDGSSIVFSSERMGLEGGEHLYMMSRDGSNIRPIGNLEIDTGGGPIFSPDGKKILFTDTIDDLDAGEVNQDVYIVDVDGNNRIRLTYDPSSEVPWAFTPDGNHILISSDRSESYDLYIMNLDGTGLVRLTDDPKDELYGEVVLP
jgi:TolB protein